MMLRDKIIPILWLMLAAVIIGGAFGAGIAKGDNDIKCVEQYWLYGGLFGRGTTRTICDKPIEADGSWMRYRNFYDGERYIPAYCSRYSCRGGYWLNEFDKTDVYRVTPDTILPDEPGHIS